MLSAGLLALLAHPHGKAPRGMARKDESYRNAREKARSTTADHENGGYCDVGVVIVMVILIVGWSWM